MPQQSNALGQFRARLLAEWLPAFANDGKRGYGVEGFREDSIRVSEFDAANFLRAMDGGLVEDCGGGRYRCAQSRVNEQIFWEGPKRDSPRSITLWLEPVITIGTLARLVYDLGWPAEHLGMQTIDYAFDLAAYREGEQLGLVIACEVKKTQAEVDHLISDLQFHSQEPEAEPRSSKPRHLNSYRKWLSLRRCQPSLLWVVGPGAYGGTFQLKHSVDSTSLSQAPLGALKYRAGL